RNFVDSFAQKRGMFFFRGTHESLSDFLTDFFYEDSDLEEIRDHAYRNQSTRKLTGFIVASNDEDFDPVSLLEKARTELDDAKGLSLSPLKEEREEHKITYRGRMDYKLKKVG